MEEASLALNPGEGGEVICPHCGLLIQWKKVTPEIEQEIIRLHKGRFSLRDIEQKVGVSFSTAGRVIRKALKDGQIEMPTLRAKAQGKGEKA